MTFSECPECGEKAFLESHNLDKLSKVSVGESDCLNCGYTISVSGCSVCGGTGELEEYDSRLDQIYYEVCNTCNGSGTIVDKKSNNIFPTESGNRSQSSPDYSLDSLDILSDYSGTDKQNPFSEYENKFFRILEDVNMTKREIFCTLFSDATVEAIKEVDEIDIRLESFVAAIVIPYGSKVTGDYHSFFKAECHCGGDRYWVDIPEGLSKRKFYERLVEIGVFDMEIETHTVRNTDLTACESCLFLERHFTG